MLGHGGFQRGAPSSVLELDRQVVQECIALSFFTCPIIHSDGVSGDGPSVLWSVPRPG